MNETISAICGVCGDASDGQHFGAVACRACAAFFRRSTVTDRKYTCRYNNNCPIGRGTYTTLDYLNLTLPNVRCMCRACRLRKCVELGMNAKSVQRNRDGLGSRSGRKSVKAEAASLSSYLTPPPSFSTTDLKIGLQGSPADKLIALPTPVITQLPDPSRPQFTLNVNCLQGLPLINEVLIGYRKLVEDRKTRRMICPGSQAQKLFGDRLAEFLRNSFENSFGCIDETKTCKQQPLYDPAFSGLQDINFDATTAMLRHDAAIAAEMVNEYFTPFSHIDNDNKQRLFRNFFASFILIERAYLTSIFFPDENDDRYINLLLLSLVLHLKFAFAHNAYFHLDNLIKYFNCNALIAHPAEAAKIFKPTYDLSRRCLKNPMVKMKFTEAEMVGLLYLGLWNEAIDGINEVTSEISRQSRSEMYRELYSLCVQSAPQSATERFGCIINFLTVSQVIQRQTFLRYEFCNML
uniref:Nuclear receptor domain-containing protein n=1 Tax=Syphacia muris TaxID=451379 RepID=A0A0N5AT73_9BILA